MGAETRNSHAKARSGTGPRGRRPLRLWQRQRQALCRRWFGNDDDNGSNGGGGSGFSELLAKAKAAKYKITYTSGDGGEVFTLAQDPPRFAYTTEGSATYVTADGAAVSCSGSGSSATCKELPGTGDTYRASLSNVLGVAGAFFLSAAGSSIPGLLDIKTSDDEIAGRAAVCATIDGSTLGALGEAIEGSYSVCVDKEIGVMLRVRSDDGSGSVERPHGDQVRRTVGRRLHSARNSRVTVPGQ